MRNPLIIIFFISIINCSFAQEEALVNVLYEFSHQKDLNNKQHVLRQDMLLSVAKDWSEYSNFEVLLKTKESKRRLLQALSSGKLRGGSAKGSPVARVASMNRSDEFWYQNTSSKELKQYENIGAKSYLIQENLPDFDWQIKNEKKKLGEFDVQRAEGKYGGREYIAWFCADLPFKNGPWKLSGLPGLILEGEDTKGEVKFKFKEIYRDEEPVMINANWEEFITAKSDQIQKLKKAYQRDPVGTFKGQFSIPIEDVNLLFIDDNGKEYRGEEAKKMIKDNDSKHKSRKDNPLELKK